MLIMRCEDFSQNDLRWNGRKCRAKSFISFVNELDYSSTIVPGIILGVKPIRRIHSLNSSSIGMYKSSQKSDLKVWTWLHDVSVFEVIQFRVSLRIRALSGFKNIYHGEGFHKNVGLVGEFTDFVWAESRIA